MEKTFIETLYEERTKLVNFPFDTSKTFPFVPIEELERLLDPNIKYDITEQKAPHYRQDDKSIHMPAREHYFSEYAFYCAALHEMAHSTKDTLVKRSFPYDQEEVVAQMTAMKIMRPYRDAVWWDLDCTYLKDYIEKAVVEYNRRTGSHVTTTQMRDACAVVAKKVVAAITGRK
jgi:antirestriction protein ArdC